MLRNVLTALGDLGRYWWAVLRRATRDTIAHANKATLAPGVAIGVIAAVVSGGEVLLGVGATLGYLVLFFLGTFIAAPMRMHRELLPGQSDAAPTSMLLKHKLRWNRYEGDWSFKAHQVADGVALTWRAARVVDGPLRIGAPMPVPREAECWVQEPDAARVGLRVKRSATEEKLSCVYPRDFQDAEPTTGELDVTWYAVDRDVMLPLPPIGSVVVGWPGTPPAPSQPKWVKCGILAVEVEVRRDGVLI